MTKRIGWILAILSSFLAAGLIWLYQPPAGWGPRLEPSGEPRVVFSSDMAFETYVIKATALAQRVAKRFETPISDADLAWRLPFFLPPADNCPTSEKGKALRGVLMVHGLTDSPATQSSLAAEFAANCYRVHALALPGHATSPGELSGATKEEWFAALGYGIASFDTVLDGPLVLVGYSTGATLGLLDQMNPDSPTADKIAAIIAMAPGLSGPLDIPQWQRRLAKLLWLFPRGRYSGGAYPDENPGRYESSPYPALFQYVLLQDAIGPLDRGDAIQTPTYFAHSQVDTTIPVDGVIDFFCKRLIGPKKFRLYSDDEALVRCGDIALATPTWPEQNVLSTGHVGILNAPNHPVFGATGFPDCRHYWRKANYSACKNAKAGYVFAESTADMLAQHLVRRASFNPDFDAMAADIMTFLDRVLPRRKQNGPEISDPER